MSDGIILILDFGSQYTNLIKSTYSQLGIPSEIMPADHAFEEQKHSERAKPIRGIVLSGGAYSVNQEKIPFDVNWLSVGIPILAICYGYQLVASHFGGTVHETHGAYGGETVVFSTEVPLFHGIASESTVWMSHADSVTNLPEGFSSIATTKAGLSTAMYSKSRSIYGLQFHPEVSHTAEGWKILENFAVTICGLRRGADWSAEDFLSVLQATYKPLVGGRKVIVGLSGGVDSSTLAVALRSFLPKERLIAVYVDTGLEKSKTATEVKELCTRFDITLHAETASNTFFQALRGVSDPDEKRQIIGRTFIRVFEGIANAEEVKILAQGTIWSDVVESGVTKYASVIKPHHNVSGLPAHMALQLIEPLRDLFKDQIRSLASFMGLPDEVIYRPVFPGPGFALRVDGVVTQEKVAIVRASTEIIEEVIREHGLAAGNFMAFAIYINARSSGIRGDMRFTNDGAIIVRAVETVNLLTARFSEKIFPCLEEISSRITKRTGVGKVLYDITNKPPSTIDWQ